MRRIDRAEFYITNICNLTCTNCNRFNNHNFKGWQRWSDYADTYRRWGKLVNVEQKVIMGGEPLLNPTILDWIQGIYQIWPGSSNQLLTNGTYLDRVDGLLETCRANHTWIGVSLHRPDALPELESRIERYLGHIDLVNHDPNGSASLAGGHHYYENRQGDSITVWDQYYFIPSALIHNDQQYSLHNSDITEAHNNCTFAQNRNYHFIRGKFYKCGPAALFPELARQFDLNLTQEDLTLIDSYKPLTIDNYSEYNQQFFELLDRPIDQCKFCPSYMGDPNEIEQLRIYPVRKVTGALL